MLDNCEHLLAGLPEVAVLLGACPELKVLATSRAALRLQCLAKPVSGRGIPAGMSKPLVSDELWARIAPRLPPEPPKPKGGRSRIPDRAALSGIIFVRRTGIPWELLPREMGCGRGSPGWWRLRAWQRAGGWKRLHQTLLDRLGYADQLDWSRARVDCRSVPAKRGAKRPGRSRRIGAHRARSTLLWSSGRASR